MTAGESQRPRVGAHPDLTVRPGLAAVVDHVPAGLLLLAADGSAVEVNQTWARLSGLTVADSLGLGWLQAVSPAYRPAMQSLVHDAAATGLAGSADMTLVTAGLGRRSRWWWSPGPAGTLIVSVAALEDGPANDAHPDPTSDPPASSAETADQAGDHGPRPVAVVAELADVVMQRLFSVGLAIQSSADGTVGSGQRLRQAAEDLDSVIRDLRSIMFSASR